MAVLSQQIELQPRNVELRLRKAALNIELQQWDYAIDEYGRVLELDPDNLSARYFRAYAYTTTRRLDMARRDYEAILQRVPRQFEAQLGLAQVLRKMGRQQETLDQMNLLVQMYPDSAVAYAARAGYEAELQRYDTALYDWDEAIRLSPLHAGYVASKTDLLLTLRRNVDARRELDAAIRRGIPRAALKEWLDRARR